MELAAEPAQQSKKWRRGDVHPETGLVFWEYNKKCKNSEWWATIVQVSKKRARLDRFKTRYNTDEEFRKQWSEKRKQRRLEKRLDPEYLAKDRARTTLAARRYRAGKGGDVVRRINRKSLKKKRQSDPFYRFKMSLRNRVREAILHGDKCEKTMRLVGCSLDFLRKHIEAQWKEGMSWDNYGRGGWSLDHIFPCSAFDLTKPEHQFQCFNWTNLQPLWEKENISKSDKFDSSILCLQ